MRSIFAVTVIFIVRYWLVDKKTRKRNGNIICFEFFAV